MPISNQDRAERDALMKNILGAPEDDELRLVFADWLEDKGAPDRANVIRLQCEAAKLSWWDRRSQEASWEADSLVERHGPRFRREELPHFDGVEWTVFERGFVSAVRVRDARCLARHAEGITAAAPVHIVELPATSDRATEANLEPLHLAPSWAKTLRFAWARAYRPEPFYTIESFAAFPESLEVVDLRDGLELDWLLDWMSRRASGEAKDPTAPTTLKSLRVAGHHTVGLPFVRELVEIGEGSAATKTAMRSLARLDVGTDFVDYDSGYFTDPTIGTAGAGILAEAKFLERLTSLDVSHQRVGTEGLAALVAAYPRLSELHARAVECAEIAPLNLEKGTMFDRVDLRENAIKDEGARLLATAGRLSRLKWLELGTCEIGPEGLAHLTSAPFWNTLRHLDLGRNPLGLAGLQVLAKASSPEHLHTLLLADADLEGREPSAVLARIEWLRHLLNLDLSRNMLTDLEGLFRTLGDGSLRKLSLARMGIDADRAAALPPFARSLYHLDLGGNPIGDAGLAAILGVEESALHTLALQTCGLTGEGVSRFVRDVACPHLHTLTLTKNALDVDALSKLLASPLMDGLRVLKLARCGLDGDAAKVIATSTRIEQLRILDLRDNDFKEAGVLALARSKSLRAVGEIALTADPWRFTEESRNLLEKRFGQGWHWSYDNDLDVDEDSDENTEDEEVGESEP
jgi:uncharacterized protein (TIGR02996 family)